MDSAKKAAFVKMAGKHRVKFSKGGLIRRLGNRKYFDTGGTALSGPSDAGTDTHPTNPNSGFVGSINAGLGLNDNFAASAANIQAGTNQTQLNNAYSDVQGALGTQQNLVNTLAPQTSSAVNNQNMLANQYSAMAQGQGPNPAQDQLAQATAKNVANQSAMMAGQRGAAGNVGLMARQAAQQGASTQQDSAGQAATLGAQQQIAAQGNLANLSNNQISQAGQATTGLNSAQQNEQSVLQNANTSYNNAAVGMQSNINNVNSQTAAANQNAATNTMGGITSAFTGGGLLAHGGVVKDHHIKLAEMNAAALSHGMHNFADGGDVEQPNLGTFKAGDDSASAPSVGSSPSLPADATNLSQSMNGGKSGSSGGGGLSSIMGLAAMLADGGSVQAPIGANPLLSSSQINGPGTWVGNYMSSGASSGPNIGATSSLPGGVSLSSAVKQKPKKDDKGSKPTAQDAADQKTYDQYKSDPYEQQMGSQYPAQPAAPDAAPQSVSPVDASGGSDMSNGQTPSASPDIFYKGGDIHKHFHEYFSEGGGVPAMVSPGEIYLTPEQVHKVVTEGKDPAKIGHKFHGKARVKGDSLKNDNIPATLQEGGIVIDRKNMGSREKRELFVHRAKARAKAGG